MSTDIKELRVGREDTTKRIMYLAKIFLLNNETIDVVAGTQSAEVAARSCEALVRLNYVSYTDIKTETNIVNEKRRTNFVIRIKKTNQFDSLYKENEENRKKKEEERENKTTPTPK
jgi:hypothetical protein